MEPSKIKSEILALQIRKQNIFDEFKDIDRQIAKIRAQCKHPNPIVEADPSTGDSSWFCNVCGGSFKSIKNKK